jgi:hypothetical protein
MLKKLILAAAGITAGLAMSVPAFADNGYRGHRQHHRPHVVHRPVIVHRPAVVHHYYRPAPRPVYVVHRAPPPPPVYVHHSHSHAGPALLFGALVGAAVVHSVLSH